MSDAAKKVVPISAHTKSEDPRDIEKEVAARVAEEKEDFEQGGGGDNNGSPPSSFIRKCLGRGEWGDGMLFARIYKGKFVYVAEHKTWFRWGGHAWVKDKLEGVYNFCAEMAFVYQSEAGRIQDEIEALPSGDKDAIRKLERFRDQIMKRKAKLETVEGQRKTIMSAARWEEDGLGLLANTMDNRPALLAVGNGVVDLETGELRDGRPEDYLHRASPVNFDPHADYSRWEKILRDIYGDEKVIAFLKRLFGAVAFGWSRDNIFPIFYGAHGQNGKDTVLEAIVFVLGDLAREIDPNMLMAQGQRSSSGPSPDIMALKGARLVVGSESNEGDKFDNGRVKLLSGGNKLVGRNPHDKDETRFPATHTLCLVTNSKPRAGSDGAFWKRALYINHPHSFVENPQAEHEKKKDPKLKKSWEHDPALASGILRWVVEGSVEYVARGGIAPPESILRDTAESRKEEDILARFVEARCEVCSSLAGMFPSPEDLTTIDENPDNVRTSFKTLWDAFEKWFEDLEGADFKSKKFLGKELSKRFKKKMSNGPHYLGIKLRSIL